MLSPAPILSQRPKLLATTASGTEQEGEGIAAQIFTSGTTAAPKAALLRHSNLVSYILGTVEFSSASEDEAALVCVPPYHIAGIAALLSSIYALRRIVMLPAFEPDAWLALAGAERVTNAFVVPTMLARIIGRMDAGATADLSALQAIAYGGGRMPLELIERALELFPDTDFTNAYGLTETSSTIALLGPEDHRSAHASNDPLRARPPRLGRPAAAHGRNRDPRRGGHGHCQRVSAAKSMCAANRCPANTASAAPSMPTAGSRPAMPAGWTTRAICSSPVAPMT